MKFIGSIMLCFASAGHAAQWQESQSGPLTPISPATEQAACPDMTGPAEYSGLRTDGGPLSRLAFDESGLHIWPAGAAISEHISLKGWDHAIQDVVSHWGWQHPSAADKSYQLFWHEPATQQLRAVSVQASPLQWQPRWSVNTAVLPAQLPALLRPQRLADDSSSDWLLLPGNTSVPVQLFDSQNGVPRLLPLPATPGNFALQPLTQDLNGDQAAERLFLLSSAGRLLQFDYQAKAGWQQHVVADLSGSGLVFDVSLQRFGGRWRHQDGHWLQGDVFVFIARKQQQYQLLAVLRPVGFSETVTIDKLSELSSAQNQAVLTAADTEASGRYGWSVPLAARPVTSAKLLAGVLYLPMTDQQNCRYPRYNQLAALQLYTGSAVYGSSQWALASPQTEPLRLAQNSETGFSLMAGTSVLLAELRTLSAGCVTCTELLSAQHMKGQQSLALYQAEQVH